ncbi:MAG TPA: HAD family hydrolase [Firmicutes bacterium]|nr:HAD family hydrolase [Bacillota bacterium]
MLDTILFDLDGTLLPMDQNDFIKAYVTQLCRRYVPCGYDKDAIIKALWTGTAAMVKNDGTCTNEDRFWAAFDALLSDTAPIRSSIPSFYTTEFDAVKEIAAPSPLAREIVDTLRGKGYDLILATNPLFPAEGVRTRLSWIGLAPEDFSLITTYDNSTFCKPFPGYYQEILQKTGKTPAQCRMVGNNPLDDMSAAKLGLDVYLVTDYIENEKDLPIDAFPQGSLASVLAWSEALPEV